jgi:hypothetical protein
MFGLIFLAASVIGLYTMYFSGMQIYKEQQHKRMVLQRAQQRMERVRYMRDYYKIVPPSENRRGIDTILVSNSDGETYIRPDYSVIITPSLDLNPYGLPQYYEVKVTYNWVERLGQIERRPYEIQLISAF